MLMKNIKKVEQISKCLMDKIKAEKSKRNNIGNKKRIINIFPSKNEININDKESLSQFFILNKQIN